MKKFQRIRFADDGKPPEVAQLSPEFQKLLEDNPQLQHVYDQLRAQCTDPE